MSSPGDELPVRVGTGLRNRTVRGGRPLASNWRPPPPGGKGPIPRRAMGKIIRWWRRCARSICLQNAKWPPARPRGVQYEYTV
eukprot:scaffold29905_cov64-Phaeocystis_antarctica.AAC.5